jgi:hypothetical protein
MRFITNLSLLLLSWRHMQVTYRFYSNLIPSNKKDVNYGDGL